jgi:glycosyltransferase domain-containing protein
MSSQLTIVIPTYERHNFLRRSMEYWGEFTGRIIIVDSSTNGIELELPCLRDYIHVPGMSIPEKLSLVINKIETKYCALCADDDFHAFDALDRAVSFLDDHQDFASVQGHYIAFSQDGGIEYGIGYHHIHEYIIDNDDPAIRMTDAMRNYMHQVYAVHRTSNLTLTADCCRGINNNNAFELIFTLVPMMAGKHRVLPMFYSAREQLPVSGGRLSPAVSEWANASDNQEEVSLWKMQLAQAFVKVTGQSLESGLSAVDKSLAAYWKFCADHHKTTPGWKAYVRPYLPDWIIEVRRRLLLREHLWHPSPRWAADSRAIYSAKDKNIPGYPWSDPDAAIAWAKMSSVIRRYGPLYEKD